MVRRSVSMRRLSRCVAFLVLSAFLLPFTILVMVADQQYNLSYNSRRVFYQESDFYKINGTYFVSYAVTTPNQTKVNCSVCIDWNGRITNSTKAY
ncbi:hypothetical protein EVAR_56206_1 [Eumeta japonica]|uniref:Uncharacterized protein n=1 Tax=Eumeta variegata TaxID=151549 RepID=A0A4C1Y732_EUMVA|nr:hypothetical protein EVAR_56206_1 [Eumeta japonica]